MLKSYVISLLVGMLAGGIYVLIRVEAPAPPIIALLGLFGMLVGEQLVPVVKRLIARQPIAHWFRHECVPKISGTPPPGRDKTP